MRVSVELNEIALARLNDDIQEALEKTAEALHTRIVQSQVVPRDTGYLQGDAMYVDYSNSRDGKAEIIHSTPYARRLYHHPEYNFRKTENPFAQGEWFTKWIDGRESDYAKKRFERFLKDSGYVNG